MGKYDELCKTILKNVGGKENIVDVKHCVTRLRFHLKDESKANDDALKQCEGVITIMKTAGQYQVVIGNHVPDVYAEFCKMIGYNPEGLEEKAEEHLPLKQKILDLITALFMPSIAMLCASGMIKGLNTILNFAGVYSDTSGIYQLIAAIGDAIFYFLPVVLGYNAAKKFRMNPFLGMGIGFALVYPTIQSVDLDIIGFNVNASYTSTVLPVILTCALAAPMERWLNKKLPDVIKAFMTPMIVLLVSVSLGFCIIGPVANQLSNVLSAGLVGLYNINPMIAGLVFGALWQVFVILGVHIGFIVIGIMNLSQGISDPLLACQVFASFAQAGVVLAILAKTKSKSLKNICVPAFISDIFGVTEPSLYGITLPRMRMFVISCIGSAIAGGYAALMGLKYEQMAGMGIFEIPALLPAGNVSRALLHSVIASVIAFVFCLVVGWMFYRDDAADLEEQATDGKAKELGNEMVCAPLSGTVKPLCECHDAAFAQGAIGRGVVVEPSEGKIYAPFDGTMMVVFPTKHALGIISKDGCDVLIHIGINTVELQGEYFKSYVEEGQEVKKGQLLMEFDMDAIQKAGYSLDTPVLITNTDDYLDIVSEKQTGAIQQGDKLLYAIH